MASMDDQFFRKLMRGTLPLLVWGAHFTFCYLLAAAQCMPGALRPGGPNRVLLGIATALALAVCLWLAWRERGILRDPKAASVLDWGGALGAVLALIAIVWNTVPVLLAHGCA